MEVVLMKNISYDQAMILVTKYNAKLIDTQLEEDYNKRHFRGSINIPVELINSRAYYYLNDKYELIVVYCLKGMRSVAAGDMLERLGFANVYNIRGGIDG